MTDDTIKISNVADDTKTINNYNQVPSHHLAFLLVLSALAVGRRHSEGNSGEFIGVA